MSMEQKLQVDIATKFIVDEQNNRTCIISTFPSVHLPSLMSKDHTVFKLLQDPFFADGWTDGQTIRQTDTGTEGKPKVPSSETPEGTNNNSQTSIQ